MGELVDELYKLALDLGVEIRVNSKVKSIKGGQSLVEVVLENNEKLTGNFLLSNAAPQVLA
ncbi:hypothetical protein EMGBS7_07250, partial [Candidatus Planktophila sp.]